MSQTSFLDSVVTWNEQECQENLQDALPKLISQLASSSVPEEELGICKIVCELFLPWVNIKDVEKLVFIHITAKVCSIMDKVLETITDLCRQTCAQNEVQAMMETFIEIVDCYSTCFKYVQSKGGNSPSLCDIHSLPYGAVHLLKGAYSHCKESGNIYGELLPGVTDLLSALFKKAHGLQMAFLGILEKISIDSQVTEDEVQDLCFICQGLFEVCQTVTSLDAKLVCSLWKTISRFSGRHSNHLKNDLDVDRMIVFLCDEIKSGFIYLFQLAPPKVDSVEMTLSQGDNAAFQKSLKVLSYQLRIMISIMDSFIDYLSECEASLFLLIICVYRHLPPSLNAPCVSDTHVAEIQRQILNGTEPLISLLVRKQKFMECVTSDKNDLLTTEDHLPFLLVLMKILDCVPKQTDDVIDKWMAPKLYEGDVHRYSLLESVFKAVDKGYLEMSLSYPEDVVVTTAQNKPVSLYQHVCSHVCGIVGSVRANHFALLEECLLVNLFSQNMYVSVLVMDAWCFMARFGTADLCFRQTQILLRVCQRLQSAELSCPIYSLVRRLVKFMAPDHQKRLLSMYPVDKNLWLYKIIPMSVFPVSNINSLIEQLVGVFSRDTQQFTDGQKATTVGDVESLISVLECLTNCLSSVDLSNIAPQPVTALSENVSQLLAVWQQEWLAMSIMETWWAELVQVAGYCLDSLPGEILVKILELLNNAMTSCSNHSVKMAAIQLLVQCKRIGFPPNAQQPQILRRIPQLFQKLLNDPDVLIHHSALNAFTQFAESTPHEEVVPQCLEDSQYLQDAVVNFLNKKPCVTSNIAQKDFMKKQYDAVSSNKTVFASSTNAAANVAGKEEETVKELHSATDERQAHGELLDDITCQGEPSLKRKRLQEEQASGIDKVIDVIETKLSDLEVFPRSALSSQNMNKLMDINTRLKVILDL